MARGRGSMGSTSRTATSSAAAVRYCGQQRAARARQLGPSSGAQRRGGAASGSMQRAELPAPAGGRREAAPREGAGGAGGGRGRRVGGSCDGRTLLFGGHAMRLGVQARVIPRPASWGGHSAAQLVSAVAGMCRLGKWLQGGNQ